MLFALVAALVAYAYWVELPRGAQQERTEQAATHLLPFRADEATELDVARPNERIVCRKEGGQWRIAAPVHTDADDSTISRVLDDLAQAHVDRTVTVQPDDLARYGLTQPVEVVAVAGERRVTLEIGKANPTDEFVFVRRKPASGQAAAAVPVLLVEKRLHNVLEKTLYDLRDKTVLSFLPDDVQAITFVNRGKPIRLVREPGEDGAEHAGWREVEPLHVVADRGLVERSLDLLSSVRAEQFVAETPLSLDRYGMAPPWGSTRFDFKGGRADTLLYGRRIEAGGLGRTYARRPGGGPVFTVNDNLPSDTRRSPSEWRERHVADFTRADVASLRLISPERTVVCAKTEGPSGTEWHLAEYNGQISEGMKLEAAATMPTAMRADSDRVDDLVAHLATLEATAFLDGTRTSTPSLGLAPPTLKVVALDKDSKTLALVSLGKRSGASRYATSPHLGSIVLVRASDTDRFQARTDNLAARQ